MYILYTAYFAVSGSNTLFSDTFSDKHKDYSQANLENYKATYTRIAAWPKYPIESNNSTLPQQ